MASLELLCRDKILAIYNFYYMAVSIEGNRLSKLEVGGMGGGVVIKF